MTEVQTVAESGLAELHALQADFARSIGEPVPDDDALERVTGAMDAGRITFLLARDEGAPVGMCSLTISFSTYRAAPFGIFDDFYVVPERRGRGVARALVNAAVAEASAHGCRSVLIGCSDGDVGMWKHFGFRKIGNMMATDLGVSP